MKVRFEHEIVEGETFKSLGKTILKCGEFTQDAINDYEPTFFIQARGETAIDVSDDNIEELRCAPCFKFLWPRAWPAPLAGAGWGYGTGQPPPAAIWRQQPRAPRARFG
eukprot:COSAG04_NODE_8764_length_933_cov_1.049161_2_plen_109_part_00